MIYQKSFSQEVLQFITNEFHLNEVQALLSDNSLHIFDKIKENNFANKIEEQILMIEQSFHPKLTLMMGSNKLYGFDRRSKDLDIYRLEREHNFGIKYFQDQYFFLTRKKSIDVFDFRSMNKPIINLKHFQEENPPSSKYK